MSQLSVVLQFPDSTSYTCNANAVKKKDEQWGLIFLADLIMASFSLVMGSFDGHVCMKE